MMLLNDALSGHFYNVSHTLSVVSVTHYPKTVQFLRRICFLSVSHNTKTAVKKFISEE